MNLGKLVFQRIFRPVERAVIAARLNRIKPLTGLCFVADRLRVRYVVQVAPPGTY
jgi:hypothetical protein